MGKLFGNGINQADLVDLIALIRTNIVGIQTKLDADATTGTKTYHTGATTAPAALPSGIQTTGVKAIHNQGVVVSILDDFITKWNATLTALDADSGVSGTDYSSLWAVTDVVGNSAKDGIFNAGVYQGCEVNVLNSLLTSINGVTTKLDADSGVADTNYHALWSISDTVDESGTFKRVRINSWIIGLLAFGALLGPCKPVYAKQVAEGNVVNSTVTISQNVPVDVGGFDRFSVQAVYSNGTPAGFNVTDGRKSTNTLTVTSNGTALVGQSIAINGVPLVFGVNITTGATNTAQALNIAAAINATSSLSAIVVATNSANVVYATATAVGLNAYATFSSTVSWLTWGKPIFNNGLASDFDSTLDQVTHASHGFVTGLQVLMSSVSATNPVGGLNAGTTYYAVRTGDNAFELATSTTNAVAGTVIDISTQTGGDSWSFTPLALVNGSAGLAWQGGNDASNWTNLSASSVTYSGAGNSIWDFGAYNYRYIRAAITAPTSGGILWTVRIRGKYDVQ